MATVLDQESLATPALGLPVLSPDGVPVAKFSELSGLKLEAKQLVLLGNKEALVVAPENSRVERRLGVIFRAPKTRCDLSPRDQVMYYQTGSLLHVLDSAGEVCEIPVIRAQRLENNVTK